MKETNRLRKEINMLLSKGMSNILKVTIETFSQNLDFLSLKICHRVVFAELQLTQISFKNSSCRNLKIRDMGAKLSVPFVLF